MPLQDMQLCVSGQERHVAQVCYLQELRTNSPFLTPHISITIAWTNFYQIYTFYAIRYIHNPIHIKYEGNRLSSSRGTCP